MRIEVLGSHGSETPTARAVGFLVEERLLLEAGTACAVLEMDRQAKITDVLICHLHLDHVKSLPFLADNRLEQGESPLTVYGISQVVEGLRKHLFNDLLWPDFGRIRNRSRPLLAFQTLEPGQAREIAGIEVIPHTLAHAVPSVGFLLRQEGRSLFYTADTAPADAIVRICRGTPDLAALFIEVSFPDRLQRIAAASGHMTPADLAGVVERLGRPGLGIHIFHMKPRYEESILVEVRRRLGDRVAVLCEGDVVRI